MTDREQFGQTAQGEAVERIAISAGPLSANIISWGAVVQDLRLDGHAAPLVLGFESFDEYPLHSPYFGAIVGRYANRIRDGRFSIDGETHQGDRNFLGKHLLHGGRIGTDKQVWTVDDHASDRVVLSLRLPDGEMGFPGNLDITCIYSITPDAALVVELEATTDRPTLANLAQHSYFNLEDGGATPALDHSLMIEAAAYLPVDGEMLPTGGPEPVDGTDFDFRRSRPIRRGHDGAQVQYDHNWCLARERRTLSRAARLVAPRSGVAMELWTTEPGLQFYAGHKIAPGLSGLGGRAYPPSAGICLEPQIWPDSPNNPGFPQAVLRLGELYRQRTEYRFF